MTSQGIHFGTSGWRGVIADDFNFSGVRRAAAAIAGHVRSHRKSPAILVAHDTRFFSEEFARTCAHVLFAKGCRVSICRQPTPTPTVAHAILHGKFDGGINVTASHNPYSYNGLKFSGPEGGPAMPDVTKDIEQRAGALNDEPFRLEEIHETFDVLDPREPYFAQLEGLVRFDVLTKAKGSFVFDAVHGCGAGWLDALLVKHGVKVSSIRTQRDVLFEGSGPDPSEENLAELKRAVVANNALAGLATDGDADRFGILDRDGSFISPNQILALVFDYLLETRGVKLGACRSIATSHLLDAVAKYHGVKVYETPVGFKYIGPRLRADEILLGGEESAGMTIRGHVPEKDGILACLLVAEMIAARQASLMDQLRDLFRRTGVECWPIRVNLHVTEEVQSKMPALLKRDPGQFAGRKVARADRTDGLKLVLEDGAWVLMRPSGTEPVVRVYAEARSLTESKSLSEEARAWIGA
ncbi:MAG TPA: phosphoglucomutase/phosphomannomutase family protein [Verrucomicrobiae bacterium]|nr:phosphoglucomutase/phosphomannomutase family protein [Verrucomicrobiae bacterium]